MGLARKTNPFINLLWDDHEKSSHNARSLMDRGGSMVGENNIRGFARDLVARLYHPDEPESIEPSPAWAERLHKMATEIEEWTNLRRTCARNGFAAGMAAETLLSGLLPLIQAGFGSSASGLAGTGSPESSEDADSQRDMRRKFRVSLREADKNVRKAQAVCSGISDALGYTLPGAGIGKEATLSELGELRDIWQRLRDNTHLQRILELAGRALRTADKKHKTSVAGAAGEYHGVERGDDVQRLLPGELAMLRNSNKLVRLNALLRISEKQTLQYGLMGKDVKVKGDMVVLVDQSSSMRDSDGRDDWAKAVAIACVSRARQEKRTAHVVTFNGDIIAEYTSEPGDKAGSLEDLLSPILQKPYGGTSFDRALLRACDKIEHGDARNADVVMITDGEDSICEDVQARVAKLIARGLSVFPIIVGDDASPEYLMPIATGPILEISNMRSFEDAACAINTDRGPSCG